MQQLKTYFFIAFIFCAAFSFSQNENSKWYFGNYVALDFMTNLQTTTINSTKVVCGFIDMQQNLHARSPPFILNFTELHKQQ
ncbi:MAG: hypothetical protein KF900_03790 [Bacteroidetes bacterium]|nr:hypothetical protein [Bacteroidota bacterium]